MRKELSRAARGGERILNTPISTPQPRAESLSQSASKRSAAARCAGLPEPPAPRLGNVPALFASTAKRNRLAPRAEAMRQWLTRPRASADLGDGAVEVD